MSQQLTWVGKCRPCNMGIAVQSDVEMRRVFGQSRPFHPTTFEPLGDKRRVACHRCGHAVILKSVAGTYNPNRPCDPRCTNATGPDCSCACGGSNHGSAYVPRKRAK